MRVLLFTSLIAGVTAFSALPAVKTRVAMNAAVSRLPAQGRKERNKRKSTAMQQLGKPGELVLEPNFDIPNSILAAVPLILGSYALFQNDGHPPPLAYAGAAIHLILGIYVWKQTNRVRCVFDKDSFEFKNIKDGELVTKPNKNYVRGTLNRWKCKSTTQFGYVPSKAFPLVTFFLETETDNEKWGQYSWWGQFFSNTYSKDQPTMHFFPGFIDIDTWEEEMLKRGAKKI